MAKILKSIFEKDQNGVYTTEALLYQDILQYPIKSNCKKFKFWEIGRWYIITQNFVKLMIETLHIHQKRIHQ
jgi:hypothetical protein